MINNSTNALWTILHSIQTKKYIMNRLILNLTITFIFLVFVMASANAQEMKAKKLDNPQWKTVGFIKFKSGKSDRGREIIRNYYEKAAQKASTQTPAIAVDLVTGEWDMMVVWDMKEGLEEMNWEISPDNVKWMAALNEIAGGADKGKAILDEFSGLIDRESSYLGKTMTMK
jgi:hypothetical protein